MNKIVAFVSLLVMSISIDAMANTYTVKAFDNSTSGGVGVNVAVVAGEAFTINVSPLDLWNAGALPRWSNANGLVGNLFATGVADANGDVPSISAGTQIGKNFGLYSQNGLTAAYGSLVGQFGSGNFFKIGTNYTDIALSNSLKLFYFDSNNFDNSGSIFVNVVAVPEPETYAMIVAGLGVMGFVARRKSRSKV